MPDNAGMITLRVHDEFKKLVDAVGDVAPRHIRRSAVVALTKTTVLAKNALQAELPKVFDRPTPWTMNSLFVRPATFATPVAEIMIKDFAPKGTPAVKYLAPGVYGGARRIKRFERALQYAGAMPRGWYAVPTKDVKLDAYGNPPGPLITRILSVVKASPDPMQNQTKKSRGRAKADYFVVTEKRGNLVPGIYERRVFGGSVASWRKGQKDKASGIRMLFVYTSSPPQYQKRLDFDGIVTTVVEKNFGYQFEFAFADAIKRFGA